MNKHILLVMKWLNAKNSVRQEELGDSRKSADAAFRAAHDASYDTIDEEDTANDAAYEAYCATYNAYDAIATGDAAKYIRYAERSIKRYFEATKEDKQIYLNNI